MVKAVCWKPFSLAVVSKATCTQLLLSKNSVSTSVPLFQRVYEIKISFEA